MSSSQIKSRRGRAEKHHISGPPPRTLRVQAQPPPPNLCQTLCGTKGIASAPRPALQSRAQAPAELGKAKLANLGSHSPNIGAPQDAWRSRRGAVARWRFRMHCCVCGTTCASCLGARRAGLWEPAPQLSSTGPAHATIETRPRNLIETPNRPSMDGLLTCSGPKLHQTSWRAAAPEGLLRKANQGSR